MNTSRRNLIIATVGDSSQHHSWLAGSESRSFDLALLYYGNKTGAFSEHADYYFSQPGFKYPLIAGALEQLGDRINQYDFIWTPDDDIATDTSAINRLFQVSADYLLPIAQPAIAQGDASYQALRQQSDVLLRYSRFAEVMCPVFSREALLKVKTTFCKTLSGWGIDWVWTRLVDERRIAVVDAVGVDHIRPLRAGEAYRRLSEQGVSPADECRRVLSEYGLRGPATHFRRRQLKYGTIRCQAIDLLGRSVVVGPRWWRQFGRAA
jgi:hypothetical protein